MFTPKINIILLCLLAGVSVLRAQDSLLLRDYRFSTQCDPWIACHQAAALTRFSAPNRLQAEVAVAWGDGGLVDFDDATCSVEATARVESFCRLSRRTVAYGAISYTDWSGSNMTGAAFMQHRLPFNLVEDSLTNPGKKHRDTYRLVGELGTDLYRGMSVGARMEYTAANYAKYKDLRHQNKLMDMRLTACSYLPLTAWLNLGADYTYHRQTESVSFGTYGKSERVYKTLIDYGAFMGRQEQFGNEGFTDKAREMPLFEEGHGVSVQAEVQPMVGLSLLGSLSFCKGDGYYGRKSPYTATYTNHERNTMEARFQAAFQPSNQKARYGFDVSWRTEHLYNYAETFRQRTSTTGANYYEYYDAVETGEKRWRDLAVGMTAQWDIRGETPVWECAATYQWQQRQQTAFLFPFYRYQVLTIHRLTLAMIRNLLCRKGVWTFAIKTACADGSGNPFQDGTFVEPEPRQESPATMDAFLYREYRYLTALQYEIEASAQYAFIFPQTHLKTYVRLGTDYRMTNSDGLYVQGDNHVRIVLAVGCTL